MCRTANGWDVNGFGQLKDGRGNICPVTIIMPTLAMEAIDEVSNKIPTESKEHIQVSKYDWCKHDIVIETFMSILDRKIHEAKDMLIERFEWICSQSPDSAKFMYENGVMEGYVPEEGIVSALKHGTLGTRTNRIGRNTSSSYWTRPYNRYRYGISQENRKTILQSLQRIQRRI